VKKLLQVLNGQVISPPPFWFMRQAGRYMQEYRDLRAEAGSFLNLCFNDEHAAEVTMQPIRAFDMDAAIIFADILLIPNALGVDLDFLEGEGPVLGSFVTEKLKYDETKLAPVFSALRRVKQMLPADKTLIGFAGSPWTVASYMIEKRSGTNFEKIKSLAYSSPKELQKLIDILISSTVKYLDAQIRSGAEVIQLFDSWAGELSDSEFEKWVITPNAEIVRKLKSLHPEIKIIGFPRRSGTMLKSFAELTKVDCMAIDHSVSMKFAADNLDCVLQGNLDPEFLLGDKDRIKLETLKILDVMKDRPFIFNLGHGINQHTPVENIAYLSELLRKG